MVQGLTGFILLDQQVNYFKELLWDSNCWLLTAAKTRLEVLLLENFLNWRNLLKRENVFGGMLISHSQKKINSVEFK